MVVFQGQRGGIGGYAGFCDWAHDSGAAFTFDEFGAVTFGSGGYGENEKVTVQLITEYGRYFCSTSVCGGFKNWVSEKGTVTPRPTGGRVTIIVMDSVQKTPVEGAKVCLGLMCQVTPANGEVYLGQFAYGTYGLVIGKTGYENFVEPGFVVDRAEIRTSRSIVPEVVGPVTTCEDLPPIFRQLCQLLVATQEAVLKPLSAFLDRIYAKLPDWETDIVQPLEKRLLPLVNIEEWQKNFTWPNFHEIIVVPVNELLQPARDVLQWTRDFKFPDWKSTIVQPISNYIDAKVSAMFDVPVEQPFWEALAHKIDVRISQKFGVDPALPFFDALYAKIEKKVDVWFSGKLGIDPALPFWDEMRKKIVSMFISAFDEVMDAIIPEPPKEKI